MAIWIDVRTEGEYSQGHLDEALNIPYDVIGSEIAAVTTDNAADIRLYCGTGRRSAMAQYTLQNMGYTNVHNAESYNELKKGEC